MKTRLLELVAPGVTLAVVLGNVVVLVEYVRSPQIVFGLINTRSNLPFGPFTAIFTPDPTVFLGTQTLTDWYVGTAGTLFVFLFLFLLVNLDSPPAERGIRSAFYGAMLVVVSIIANLLTLAWGMESAGPSTAVMTAIGLVFGFSWASSIGWLRRGMPTLKFSAGSMGTFIGLAVAVGLLVAVIALPDAFFNVAQNVDWASHVFCFVVGTTSALAFATRGRTYAAMNSRATTKANYEAGEKGGKPVTGQRQTW